MNILWIVLGSAVILVMGYIFYGKFLATKVFKLDDSKVTPGVEMNDGNEYLPTTKNMLMSQHFSAIAAAGPINGPILAGVMFGWVPALIYILVGSIFIGGVHDMGSLVASVRYKARSITEVIRVNISKRAWLLFMLFIWITLVYIIVTFTDITASSFVGVTKLENGDQVTGSSIAASSVLYLILPIIMGFLMKFAHLKEKVGLLIFIPLVGVAIWAGHFIPISLPASITNLAEQQHIWGVIILIYCLIAALCPMWMILQPRGAIGGYFLYISLLCAAIGVAFGGYIVKFPAFTNLGKSGAMNWFPMLPVLFTTIGCGACSGFHSLVSSGTTSKQLSKESDAKPVGYGSMILEGMVAVTALTCLMILPNNSEIVTKAPNLIYASGIGSFLELIGIPGIYGVTFGLMAFTTFVYDTLDVCTRLGRYIIQELTGWKGFKGAFFGTLLTAGIPLIFIFQTVTLNGKVVPAWKTFWNTFGASNLLLASLALVGVTVCLIKTNHNKTWLVSFIPACIAFFFANWSLIRDIYTGWGLGKGHPAIPFVSLILIVLSCMVVAETYKVIVLKPGTKDANGAEIGL